MNEVSGDVSSGLLVDEVRVGQALRDFWWTKREGKATYSLFT